MVEKLTKDHSKTVPAFFETFKKEVAHISELTELLDIHDSESPMVIADKTPLFLKVSRVNLLRGSQISIPALGALIKREVSEDVFDELDGVEDTHPAKVVVTGAPHTAIALNIKGKEKSKASAKKEKSKKKDHKKDKKKDESAMDEEELLCGVSEEGVDSN
jgi:hypothetical protein